MNQYRVERQLSGFYTAIVISGLFTIVCTAIPWNHWKWVLDVCPDDDCGCILYGVSAFTYFTGGKVRYCHFVIYGSIPIVGIALVMAAFHVLRVCINNIGKYEKNNTTIEHREGEMIVMTARSPVQDHVDPVSYCWIPASVIGSLLAVYSLSVAVVLTDGYFKTCNQYRGELIKSLRATGSQTRAIHGRLPCQAIFDFMDYLQPDVLDRHRGEFINTGLSLQLAIISAWFTVIAWICCVILNSIRARKDRDVITCCGK